MNPITTPSSAMPALRQPNEKHRIAHGLAHAKSIVIGEHAVVYGAPAIAVPVSGITVHACIEPSRRSSLRSALYTGTVDAAPASLVPVLTAWHIAAEALDLGTDARTLTITSDIPVRRGLGSSAAVAAAVTAAVAAEAGVDLTTDEHYRLIQHAERVAHGTPSGIDARTVISDTPLRFQNSVATPILPAAPFHFVIADTGVHGSTSQAVGTVRTLRDTQPLLVDRALEQFVGLTDDAETALSSGNHAQLGTAMNTAHDLLGTLGVSCPELDTLVNAATGAGALGAKLTGSGQGGCMLALVMPEQSHHVQQALLEAGAVSAWTTTLEADA